MRKSDEKKNEQTEIYDVVGVGWLLSSQEYTKEGRNKVKSR